MNFFQAAAVALTISVTGIAVCAPVSAQTAAIVEASTVQTQSGAFFKRSKKLKGNWEVVQRGDKTVIVFSDDFRAAKGPDLKIFLSPNLLADVTGKTAVDGSINLGVLKSTRGTQEYEIPASVNLADYSSILVHCEEYAILWGGGEL